MPATVEWYIPAHIVHMRLSGRITPADIAEVAEIATEMITSVETPLVHLLIDLEGITEFSKNVQDYMKLSFEHAPNTGWRIFIGGNTMMRFIANILANRLTQRIASIRMTCLDNYDQAIRFISDRDPYLTADIVRHLRPRSNKEASA